MIPGGILQVKVTNPTTGESFDLKGLFYGDGSEDDPLVFEDAERHTLLRWSVVDSEDKMDVVSFTLDNPLLTLIDHPALAKGNIMEVQFGYANYLSEPRKYKLTGRSGWRELTISGESLEESQLAFGVATEKFENKTLADVAKELFTRDGLTPEVDSSDPLMTKTRTVLHRTNETVYQFLKRMAKRVGLAYEVYADRGTGYFVPKKFKDAPIMVLKYGTEEEEEDYITIGEPTFNDEQINTGVEETVRGQDLLNKKAVEGKASNETSKQTSLGKGTFMYDKAIGKFRPAGPGKTADTGRARTTAKQTKEEVEGIAAGYYDKKNAKAFSITWQVIGNPHLVAKTTYQIKCGVLSIDQARWYAENVRHDCDGGDYVTTLELVGNALGQAAENTETATPAGGTNTAEADPNSSDAVKYKSDEAQGAFVPTNVASPI